MILKGSLYPFILSFHPYGYVYISYFVFPMLMVINIWLLDYCDLASGPWGSERGGVGDELGLPISCWCLAPFGSSGMAAGVAIYIQFRSIVIIN